MKPITIATLLLISLPAAGFDLNSRHFIASGSDLPTVCAKLRISCVVLGRSIPVTERAFFFKTSADSFDSLFHEHGFDWVMSHGVLIAYPSGGLPPLFGRKVAKVDLVGIDSRKAILALLNYSGIEGSPLGAGLVDGPFPKIGVRLRDTTVMDGIAEILEQDPNTYVRFVSTSGALHHEISRLRND